MTVSKRTRFEVLRRDGYACRYCHATDVPLVVDHVLAVALGGSDDSSNLVAACKPCNTGKSSTAPDQAVVAEVSDDAIRWAGALEQAAVIMQAERAAGTDFLVEFYDAWELGTLPRDWKSTVLNYMRRGLPREEIMDACQIAQDARYTDYRWAYFCGVVKRKLERMQDIAAELLEAGDGPG